ncbi:MAG: GHKL domain-containing protein, partial [Ruminococcus sp.]|nr:GHKL domain-containing protein [Ruminococcus sp.]
NHFLKLKYDLENGNYTKANEYIENMTDNLMAEKEFVNMGNVDFDSLLNYKLSIAEEMNVNFSYHVVLPEELQVDSFDLTVILGNLLDNSLNALKSSNIKLLNIDINYSIGMIVIKIENTFSGMNNTYDNPEEHGYGLISVRTSLEKYNGKLQNDIIDNKYVVKAILYNLKRKT